jgi:hypothetical protein
VPGLLAGVVTVACGGGKAVRSDSAGAGKLGWTDPAAGAPDLAVSPPFAAPGEQMAYRLSLHRVEVAAFSIVVGGVTEAHGRRVLPVEAGVQSTGIAALVKKVRTEFASWIDIDTGRPLLSRVTETAGVDDPSIETSEARYHAARPGTLPIALIEGEAEKVEEQVVAGATVWDVPSILLHLRGWKGEVGDELTAEVVRSRYIWRSRLRIAARESVVTELGSLPAVRIEGVARRVLRDGTWEPNGARRNFSVWISDDADRVPVLIVAHTEYGDVRMQLVEYRPGSAPNLAAGRTGAGGGGGGGGGTP